jgi:hypothetical protein
MGGLYVSSELRDDAEDFLEKLWDEDSGPTPNRSTRPGIDN